MFETMNRSIKDIDKEIFYEKLNNWDEDEYTLFEDMVITLIKVEDNQGQSRLRVLYNKEKRVMLTDKPVNFWCGKELKTLEISGARYFYGRTDIYNCLIREVKVIESDSNNEGIEEHPLRCLPKYPLGNQLHDRAFRNLYELKASMFEYVLSQLLHYMHIRGVIKRQTYINIKSALRIDGSQWRVLLPNGDGTYRLYRTGLFREEVFKLEDLHSWIVDELLHDEIITEQMDMWKKSHTKSSPFEKEYDTLIHMLDQYDVPMFFRNSFESLRDLDIIGVTETHLYYMVSKKKSFSLYRLPYDSTWMSGINLKKAIVIAEGLDYGAIYCKTNNAVYCKYKSLDAYMRYDTVTGYIVNTYNCKLMKVTDEGKEFFIDRDERLCCKNNEEVKIFPMEETECWVIRDNGDIIVQPHRMSVASFEPYVIKDGKKIKCSSDYKESEMWKLLMNAATNTIMIGLGASLKSAIHSKELSKVPSPFNAREILKRIDELTDKQCISKRKSYPLKSLIRLLIRKGVIAPEENICDVLDTLFLMYKLCKKDIDDSKFVSIDFFITVKRLAARDDFCTLMQKNPKELFKKNIRWTEEEHNEALANRWQKVRLNDYKRSFFCSPIEEKIGYFEVKNGEIYADLDYVYNGIVDGKNIICRHNCNDYRGSVYYDRVIDKYICKVICDESGDIDITMVNAKMKELCNVSELLMSAQKV